ncbi:lysophospholipase Plb1 [Aulographum hederae CBS 113979]|uniref:Lysophospholipase n=1 Tax=Aulographum hederae CBS 113979 TaxID=1176131 RepID=A0A6G1GMS6_9PEZI|nr:lysophospholipase Plb1 [Aulographum hederae CBS 113979]
MKVACLTSNLVFAASLIAGALANPLITREQALETVAKALAERATPQAPDGYTPEGVNCPSTRPSIRSAAQLSPEERSWLSQRRNNTVPAMRDLLGRLNITGFDVNSYMDRVSNNASALPNIAIAASGGGYRALMNGAGAVAAFDSRTSGSNGPGQIGGLLQSATYLAGLSGGGWLVGSLYVNNFTSVQSIIDASPDDSYNLWQFQNPIYQGPERTGIQLLDSAGYFTNIYQTVEGKEDAGFNVSITDYWGRALAFQLVNATEGGPAYTWSSIQTDPAFSQANAPMPILVADGRAPGEQLISSNSTVYEMNPWEIGSWDPTVFGFAPMRYVGSNFSGGALPANQDCISGFDNAGYVMGTSSSLFNQALLMLNTSSSDSGVLRDALTAVLSNIGEDSNDIADWSPNPFYHYNNDSNPNAASKRLTLVDGGEDLQNIPLYPVIQPERHVDVIFAIDSSADTVLPDGTTTGWPNGTSLVATYQRSLNPTIENGTAFPAVPDQNTFINLGLNHRPTFFGCDSSNQTGDHPLVVYLPNAPYVYNTNFSTFDPVYNISERNAAIMNGYDVATMGNGTVDSMWPTCVGCAILSRSLERTGTQVPDVCNMCFERYCWNGTIASELPNPPYNPSLILEDQAVDVTSGAAAGETFSKMAVVGMAAIAAAVLAA